MKTKNIPTVNNMAIKIFFSSSYIFLICLADVFKANVLNILFETSVYAVSELNYYYKKYLPFIRKLGVT